MSEVAISNIISTDLVRLESEFYTATSFKLDNPFIGKDIIDSIQYGTSKELNEEQKGFPVLRLNEFESMFISKPAKYCSKINTNIFNSLKLQKDDVLICRTNGNSKYVGKSAIVPQSYEYAYASYLFKVRPKREHINSATLSLFLNSKYGRMEIEKHSMASNQVNFSPAKFRQLRIPRFSKNLNNLFENFVYKAFTHLKTSKSLYAQAEEILLKEIGLKDFEPSNEAVNIKSFNDSFAASGRLDAEYYQKKYDDYIGLIKSYKNGFEILQNACNPQLTNFNPSENTKYKYIELSNIGKSGDITGCTINLGKELPSRARRLVKEKDVIISSIEGSLDSCALITNNYANSLCSTGFYVINSDKINSETLLVLFKSEPMQNLLKQNCSGTILTAINKDEFLNIPIPIIDYTKQQEIAKLIEKSFSLKAQSEKLLEVAKTAVEIAIEQNEEIALEYIKKHI